LNATETSRICPERSTGCFGLQSKKRRKEYVNCFAAYGAVGE